MKYYFAPMEGITGAVFRRTQGLRTKSWTSARRETDVLL